MVKLYIARHKIYDMYWGRKCDLDIWVNNISDAVLLTRKQWEQMIERSREPRENIQLYERDYTND